MSLRQKSFEIFRGMYDFGTSSIRSGFFPAPVYGQAAPPTNIARTNSGGDLTPKGALEISTVWSCVWLISEAIATLPFYLNRQSAAEGYAKADTDNPLYSVLNFTPNTFMTAADYWTFMVASALLWGGGYSKKIKNSNGDVISLNPLLAQFMTPYRQEGTGALRYRYLPGGPLNLVDSNDFSADEVFHLRDKTLDGLVGLSRIDFARHSMGLARASETASADVYRSGMKAAGLLKTDKILKKEQKDEIKQSLEKFKTGGPDASSFMVLEAGLSFEKLTIDPQDVELILARQFSVEDVCRWFQVPPVLIGHAAAGVTSWGSGIEQLIDGFKMLCLRPIVRKIEQAVRKQLVKPADQPACTLCVDLDDLMATDAIALGQLYSSSTQNGIVTRNEIRRKKNLPPKPGGDQLTVQSNLIPLDRLGDMGGQPTIHIPPAEPAKPKKEAA